MKILYYSSHPDLRLHAPTGSGTHMREMIAAFRRAGHDVQTLIIGGEQEAEGGGSNGRPSPGSRLKAVAKRLIPQRRWESMRHRRRMAADKGYAKRLETAIERYRPDFIYERAAYLQPSGVQIASRLGIPHVLEINTPVNAERRYLGQPNSRYEDEAERVEQYQLANTSLTVVVSPAMIDYFVDKYGVQRDRIICTPNGVDIESVKFDDQAARRIRMQHGLDSAFVVGFVGCMARWQRVDLLIEALGLLKDAGPEIEALLVGGTPDAIEALRSQARSLGVSDKVHLTGSVPKREVYDHVAAMDVCVLPDNLWYGSPTKLFEYAALKKPTIAPDNVTLRSIIDDGVHGRLVPPNAAALAQAIQSMCEDRDAAGEMGQRLFDRVAEEFTWDRNVGRIEQTLQTHQPGGCSG